jgi:hypothetical protein
LAFNNTFAVAPSFDKNFGDYLTDSTPDQYWRVENVFNLCISRKLSLMDNIKFLFYPNIIKPIITNNLKEKFPELKDFESKCWTNSEWWQLRDVIRVVWFAILFLFIVFAWINFMLKAKEADWIKKATSSLIYIAYWAFLVFGAIRILWYILNIPNINWSWQLVNKVQNWLFLQILWFFKVLAFFLAIIMMIVYWFRIMAAMDKEDKIKTAQKWIINVILALVLIKIIDYVFYIAQVQNFWQKATDLIIDVAKTLWYILGAVFIIWIFYAWFLMITSSWKEETFKKAKSIFINIFLVATVIFLFLLILYQIFSTFAK